jgi:phage-related tail protein
MYRDGKLPSADMITRARRKVQQECADLRGEKYEERHKEEKNVRDNIND